jgi:hypothetical protein
MVKYDDSNARAPLRLIGQPGAHVTLPMTLAFGAAVGGFLLLVDANVFLARLLGAKTGPALLALFVIGTGVVNMLCAGLVAGARSRLNVPVPFFYPSQQDLEPLGVSSVDRHVWLCTVRVQDNYLETLPQMLAAVATCE